jgi:hypothetical protein
MVGEPRYSGISPLIWWGGDHHYGLGWSQRPVSALWLLARLAGWARLHGDRHSRHPPKESSKHACGRVKSEVSSIIMAVCWPLGAAEL